MRDLITVAEFTIKDMIKRKSFVISMIIILVLIMVGFNIPNIINTIKGEDSWNSKILLIDSQNLFEGNLEILNSEESPYDFIIQNKDISKDEIKNKIEKEEIDCCLKFIKNSERIVVNYYVGSVASFGQIPSEVLNSFSSIYKDIQISKLGLSTEQLIELNIPFNVNIIRAIYGDTFFCLSSFKFDNNRENIKNNGNINNIYKTKNYNSWKNNRCRNSWVITSASNRNNCSNIC